MIIPQSDLDLILNRRIRLRTLHLPVLYGGFGERKRCPLKPGSVRELHAQIPYERYRAEVDDAPTRARAVLALIERCMGPSRTATITVTSVELQDDAWVVGFILGERELEEKPRLLAANPGGPSGDYTTVAALALSGAAEEIPEHDQGKYARAADEARRTGLVDRRQRLLALVSLIRLETARQNMGPPAARRRLKSVEHQLRCLEREARRVA